MTNIEIILLIINGIILPISGWVLLTVIRLGKAEAAASAEGRVWRESRDHEIVAMRTRLDKVEIDLTDLKIKVAKFTGGGHPANDC
jgi:hypothetical protein